jgi:condensin-2 complex subunit H2
MCTDTDSVVDARAFEALCRAHIAKFAKGAEKYASETQLTQRVDKWQEKLEPLLVEEEARPVFDIHEYGKTILTSVEEVLQKERSEDDKPSATTGSIVDFVKVTKDCPNYQVCRYFLATLGLCNSGNVVLEQSGDGSTNSLSIKLLSTDFSRPMDNYLAPSAAVE